MYKGFFFITVQDRFYTSESRSQVNDCGCGSNRMGSSGSGREGCFGAGQAEGPGDDP